jgi:hypothetical protein
MAASFLDTLADVVVTREEVNKSEEFCKLYLSAIFPDLDLRDNVALSDLVIRPNATLLAMITKGLAYYQKTLSIAGVTDDSPEADVDKIMANLFISRLSGRNSIVRARLYFLRGDRDIYVTVSNTFSPDNSTFFRPITDTFIPSPLEYDSSKDEFFYDIDLVSIEQTEASNLESGDLVYHSQVDPYFVQATVLYLKSKSIVPETNTKFLERAPTAISTRNAINDPSIKYALTSNFNYFNKIVPIGMAEPEMRRDLARIENPFTSTIELVHLGGKVDIYVNADITSSVNQHETDSSGVIYLDSSVDTIAYIRRATSDELIENDLTDDIPLSSVPTITVGAMVTNPLTQVLEFQPVGENNDVGLSSKQVTKIQFSGISSPSTASFFTRRLLNLVSVQSYLEDSQSRVICADYLARSLNIYYLSINLRKVGNLSLQQSEIDACFSVLSDYVNALPAGESLVVATLTQKVVSEVGILNLDSDVRVSFEIFNRDVGGASGGNGGSGMVTSVINPAKTFHFILGEVTSVSIEV